MLTALALKYVLVFIICNPTDGRCDEWAPETEQYASYADCKREERKQNARLPSNVRAECKRDYGDN